MDDLIFQHGLSQELDDVLIQQTGNTNWFLGLDAHLDETSDAEDPEQEQQATIQSLRSEATDQSTMVQAVQQALECGKMRLDVEHARMALEDMRSQQLRAASQSGQVQ